MSLLNFDNTFPLIRFLTAYPFNSTSKSILKAGYTLATVLPRTVLTSVPKTDLPLTLN